MITALDRAEDRILALDAGADDFMSKPVERLELVARVRSALRLRRLRPLDSAEQVIFSLAAAVEAKDSYTSANTNRVAESGAVPWHAPRSTEEDLDALYRGGIIHDIGKIGVPDAVLLKPGPLDANEIVLMRRIPKSVRTSSPAALRLGPAAIIRHHHEAYDGRGYPDGLVGLPSRCWRGSSRCVMRSTRSPMARPYRKRLSEREAIAILTAARAGSGTRSWSAC